MTPRVLFVDHAGELGGAELMLLDVVTELRDTCNVLLFQGGSFAEALVQREIAHEILVANKSLLKVGRGGKKLEGALAIPALLKLSLTLSQEARKYDVIYANSQKAMLVSAIAGWLARKPVVWHLHDILTSEHFSSNHIRIAVSVANRLVSQVVVNSEATGNAFRKQGGAVKDVEVVYNGFSAEPFENVDLDAQRKFVAELGLVEKKIVGLFGRISRWKGQHVLLEAIARIDDVHALVVGGALFQDDEQYEEELRDLANELDIQDRVHFMGFRNDIPVLMKAVDIVVHASTSPEPFGRVIVEGMLARKPVIASAEGGALEIITDGADGFLISPGDSESLARHIEHLFSSKELAFRLGQAGYQTALERFSTEQMLSDIQSIIQRATDRSSDR